MIVCLDTNAYSALARHRRELVDFCNNADRVIVPSVVCGELFAGFGLGARCQQNRKEFDAFLELPGVEIAVVTVDVADRYGDLFVRLRKAGTPIPTNDLWVAATAMEFGARLVTYDRHFGVVPGLLVVSP